MTTPQTANSQDCVVCQPWRSLYGRLLEGLVFALMVILFV